MSGQKFTAAAGLWADSVSAAAGLDPAAGLGRVAPRERNDGTRGRKGRRCDFPSGSGPQAVAAAGEFARLSVKNVFFKTIVVRL